MIRSIVATALVCAIAPQAGATSVAIASCRTDANVGYYYPQELAGGLTMVWVWDAHWGENKRLVLASCEADAQLTIDPVNNELEEAAERVTQMVASAQSYSFQDVADTFHPDLYNTQISTIQLDGCLCADQGS